MIFYDRRNSYGFGRSSLPAKGGKGNTAGVAAMQYVAAFLRSHVSQRGDAGRLAKRLELSQGYVSELLAGKGNPTLDTLDQIAAKLDTDVAQIFRATATTEGAERAISPVTSPVTAPPETGEQSPPGEEAAVSSSLTSSPSHLALYALIGKLTEEQADTATEAVLDVVRRVQRGDAPPPAPQKRHGK